MSDNNLKIETELNEISKKLVDSIDNLIDLKKMIYNTATTSVNQLLLAFQAQFEHEKDAIEESIRKDNEKIVKKLEVKIAELESELKDITEKSIKINNTKTGKINTNLLIDEISKISLDTFKEKFTINDKILPTIVDISNSIEKKVLEKINEVNEK